jgi:pre-mRNA-processing factor 6
VRVFLYCSSAYPDFTVLREAKSKRGEEAEVDPEQYQDPDNEVGLFAGTVYEQDDEEADNIYDEVDKNMDARRRARRFVRPSPNYLTL